MLAAKLVLCCNEKANGDSALSNFFDISDILILPKITL